MKIAVLGAGNAGCTFAAHLSLNGHRVSLYEPEELAANLEGFREKREIEIIGSVQGVGRVHRVTTRAAEALEAAEAVIVPVPGFAQEPMMETMIPHLRPGQMVVFLPGNYAALRLHRRLRGTALEGRVAAVETSSMIYACRRTGPAQVHIRAIKKRLPIAAMPAGETGRAVEAMNVLFGGAFVPARNVLEISLDNPNGVVHCPTCVLNAGWIQTTGGDFDFYWDGMSEAVCSIMADIDACRLEIGRRLGLGLLSLQESLRAFYGLEAPSLHELLTTSPVHGHLHAPSSLRDRYVTEDVPFGLVPLAGFGRLAGVETPSVDAIIRLASLMNGTDYRETGITLEKLGLDGLSAAQAVALVETGAFEPARS